MVGVCRKKECSKAQSQTRTLSRGHSRRLLSHRSGTGQKFHTNYTDQAKPRCFCNCLCRPAQKRKEEEKKNSGPWWWPRRVDRQQKEKSFGLCATRTKDRMCSSLMVTVTGSLHAHVNTIKMQCTTTSLHGLDVSSLHIRHYKVMICRQASLKPTELYFKILVNISEFPPIPKIQRWITRKFGVSAAQEIYKSPFKVVVQQ